MFLGAGALAQAAGRHRRRSGARGVTAARAAGTFSGKKTSFWRHLYCLYCLYCLSDRLPRQARDKYICQDRLGTSRGNPLKQKVVACSRSPIRPRRSDRWVLAVVVVSGWRPLRMTLPSPLSRRVASRARLQQPTLVVVVMARSFSVLPQLRSVAAAAAASLLVPLLRGGTARTAACRS